MLTGPPLKFNGTRDIFHDTDIEVEQPARVLAGEQDREECDHRDDHVGDVDV